MNEDIDKFIFTSVITTVVPQCMYAVNHLWHVFAVIHVCCFWIEYLKEETIKNTGHLVFYALFHSLIRCNRRTLFTPFNINLTNRSLRCYKKMLNKHLNKKQLNPRQAIQQYYSCLK